MIILSIICFPYAKGHYPEANVDDWVVFGLFFLGGALCFGLSTAYHVVANHSHAVNDTITGLICSGSAPLPLAVSHQAYGTRFPTSRGTRRYIGLAFVKHHGSPSDSREVLTLTNQANLAAQLMAAIFVLFVRRFRQPEWRPLRGFLFSFMASSALYPIIYASFF